MLTQSQKYQLKRLKELYKKYKIQGTTITREGQILVFRNGKKANCVSIDNELRNYVSEPSLKELL
jgi:hypothetical protein